MEHVNVYETVMAMKHAVTVKSNTYRDKHCIDHLTRYVINRNARTNQSWHVVDVYYTNGNGRRVAPTDDARWYLRAIIANEHGERVRVYYRYSCWVVA